MRPLRLVLAICFCTLTVLLLSLLATRKSAHTTTADTSTRFRTLFDWHTPSSLFPPSAIISLTDDNSTFFLARPANFGPLLPSRGLSGQLWIGSGFVEEDLGQDGGIATAEGELGCSDVPGWDQGSHRTTPGRPSDVGDRAGRPASGFDNTGNKVSGLGPRNAEHHPPAAARSQDGTDDHLHHPLPSSHDPSSKSIGGKTPGHADIQSIQESAEIAGKVVLLSRGGCGFLEKVKWVQRRGGTALIVGDNIRGGPLVNMYARGDTSNVTIPSLFTSHTTAHLLSSLIPPGGLRHSIGINEAKRLGLALGSEKQVQAEILYNTDGRQNQQTSSSKPAVREGKDESYKLQSSSDSTKLDTPQDKNGWLHSLIHKSSVAKASPENNGRAGWILQEEFEEKQDGTAQTKKTPAAGKGSSTVKQKTGNGQVKTSPDGFVIGIQDWRDPDLVAVNAGKDGGSKKSSKSASAASKPPDDQEPSQITPQGGSITPGSGEYGKLVHASELKDQKARKQPLSTKMNDASKKAPHRGLMGWLKTVPGRDSKDWTPQAEEKTSAPKSSERLVHKVAAIGTANGKATQASQSKDKPHEGLWVTLQPTTMSSSPFFDTLLVLVVSPLVTLTFVYLLLLLRSRIRRRRWRAPKSVVDRLPVRTYQTIASSSATTSSAQISPSTTNPPSPNQTTPLLQSSGARSILSRPRSRTTGEVPIASSSLANRTPPANMSLEQIQEKREAGLSEWRRKYGGKQKECVVCLEEYVDGVSRVMSLPCGHEFHAECITPWLTTRRRTCPICKGDVVRSMARSTGNNAPSGLSREQTPPPPLSSYDTYEENDIDDDETHEARRHDAQNTITGHYATDLDEGSMTRDDENDIFDDDLERGITPDGTNRQR